MDSIMKVEKQHLEKMKWAQLLSTLGAGVLGAGIALLFPNILAAYTIPILLLGLAAHAVGMLQMRGIEQKSSRLRVGWMEALYWFCWLALAGLFLYILIRLV